MLNVKRLIQINMFVLAILSSTLLGLGMESQRLIVIALVGATLGFIVCDLFDLFRIEGALANIASIVILYLAMNSFFSVDSTGKLVAVANLLIYLQTILMFQEKTPRLNWQILVLSLLQVVVGTIFSLDLEAGLLFLLYFFVAGLAMVLQSVYSDAVDIERRNRKSAVGLRKFRSRRVAQPRPEPRNPESGEIESAVVRSPVDSVPLLFFDPGDTRPSAVSSMFLHLVLWISVSTAFASVLFYLVPRHARPWYGPSEVEVTSTGISKSVDLDERGLIPLSGKLIFRVNFAHVRTGETLDISADPPYFRGLALSNLVIEDGKTNWQAPHDRVSHRCYQEIPFGPAVGIPVHQTITLEETVDPLIYGVMPFYRSSEYKNNRELSFCHEISALSRGRANERIDLSPFKYEAGTIVDENGRFCKSWPYISNKDAYEQKPMSHDPPQHEWLTIMDPARYESLVGVSKMIVSENQSTSGGRIELLRAYEKYFLSPGRFKYTLDFRQVKRNDRLDPTEDFVRNHRSGHCELFASALTLMLRQQDIPARLVVGFHGAEHNSLTGGYMVQGKHAHAWVEAYLRPEDCPQEMFDNGQAGPGGAWLILDPTPFSIGNETSSVGDGAIDLARTVWDDFVLGIDADDAGSDASFGSPLFGFLSRLDVVGLESEFKRRTRFARQASFKYVVAGILALVSFLIWMRAVSNSRRKRGSETGKAGRLRRLVAGAISLISPGLGAWVMEGATSVSPTAFYQRMHGLLEAQGLSRRPSQTHREFATEVVNHFERHPAADFIGSTVREITELFNEVRFGSVKLEDSLSEQIDVSLIELKEVIQTSTPNESG
jgi:hypothetical protein